MTEREKMLSGQLYDPSDEELVRLRRRAFRLVEQFNRLQKEDTADSTRAWWGCPFSVMA